MGMSFPHCDINDLEGLLWTHVALLSLCGILIFASFSSQLKSPAPYGRHADPVLVKAWGFPIPQRVGHIVSDATPGILLCLMVYLLYAGLLPPGGSFSEVRIVNVVLLCGWLLHYLYRGIIHPLIMQYSSKTCPVGITLGGLFPNVIFTYLIAAQLACTKYPDNWASQPRFIIGVVLYCLGTAINRWADLKLRAGRIALRRQRAAAAGRAAGLASAGGGQHRNPDSGSSVTAAAGQESSPTAAVRESLLGRSSTGHGDGGVGDGRPSDDSSSRSVPPLGQPGPQTSGAGEAHGHASSTVQVRSEYFIPRGGLYELVSCPNYLGELVEFIGYAIALWSWPALAWVLFCASTFIPRSFTHHRWYKQHFGDDYPANRKALIPYIL